MAKSNVTYSSIRAGQTVYFVYFQNVTREYKIQKIRVTSKSFLNQENISFKGMVFNEDKAFYERHSMKTDQPLYLEKTFSFSPIPDHLDISPTDFKFFYSRKKALRHYNLKLNSQKPKLKSDYCSYFVSGTVRDTSLTF